MKRFPLFSAIIATLLPFLASTGAGASSILFDNFAETPDNSKPSGWVFSANVRASVSPGNLPEQASEGAKALHITHTAAAYATFNRNFDRFTSLTEEGLLSVSLKLNFNSLAQSSWVIYINDTLDSTMISPVGLQIHNGSLSIFGGTGSVGVTPKWQSISAISITTAQWYQIEFVIDLKSQTYVFKMSDLEGGGQAFETAPLYFASDASRLNNILFRTLNTNSNPVNMNLDWSITDLGVHSIPEGGTVALLGLGGLFLTQVLIRSRSRKQH